MNKKVSQWFFYLLFCLSLAFTWFFHRDAVKFNDRSELWSDRAGYYIYLPATFFYRFDTHRMPADLDISTGGGFSIDTAANKLDTKYTYGVALMQTPFFLTARLVSAIAGFDDENGFSMLYIRMLHLSAVIWFMLGIFYLKRFLDDYFKPGINLAVILALFAGTNLFYYTLIDGMMSHVYSFALFAGFLWYLKRYLDSGSFRAFLFMIIFLGMAILIRPTNMLLFPLIFLWDARGLRDVVTRIRQFLKPGFSLTFISVLFILFLPQMIYWKYLSGHWFHFSYRDEGFDNVRDPKIMEVLFSPVNGLFIYAPILLFCVGGIIYMIIARKRNGWIIAALFVAVAMVSASWRMWYFGCGYGQRNFIEYLTILAVPLGWVFSLPGGMIVNQRRTGNALTGATADLSPGSEVGLLLDAEENSGNFPGRHGRLARFIRFSVTSVLFFLVFFSIYYNIRYTTALYRFERCYFGSTWDWDHYLRSVEKAGILQPERHPQGYCNDFENLALSPVRKPSKIFTRSGQYSIAADRRKVQTPIYSLSLDALGHPYPRMIGVTLWVIRPGSRATGASLGYRFLRDTTVVFTDKIPIDSSVHQQMVWTRLTKDFIIPDLNDSIQSLELFLENRSGSLFFVDDLSVRFRYGWGVQP